MRSGYTTVHVLLCGCHVGQPQFMIKSLCQGQKADKKAKRATTGLYFLHSNFQGIIITPPVESFLGSYFNFKKEFKELFFISKNDPRY